MVIRLAPALMLKFMTTTPIYPQTTAAPKAVPTSMLECMMKMLDSTLKLPDSVNRDCSAIQVASASLP